MNTYKLLLVVLSAISVTQSGWGQIATSFDYPADDYFVNGLGWGGLNDAYIIDGLPGKHVAEDYLVDAGTAVKAAGAGQVMYSRAHGDCPNWGYLIIIEHLLLDDTKICTLYAHSESIVSEGALVQKDQVIGYVSHFDCWADHLHFGVFNGPYDVEVGVYPVWAVGYLSQYSWPGNYLEPSSFIAAHSQSPGEITFDYPDFTSVAGLNLVGSAAQYGSVLRLTPTTIGQAGDAWFAEKLYVQDGFETTFEFQLSEFSYEGADGIALVIQDSSATALGEGGWGIGYLGIPRSIAFEIDTFSNAEINGNHVAIHSMGTLPNRPDGPARIAQNGSIPNVSDSQVHTFRVVYTASGEFLVFLDNLVSSVLDVPIDLAALLQLTDGTAWVGLTASTGAYWENHDILSWSFATTNTLPKPDLVPTLQVSPEVLRVGDTAAVNGNIDNWGDAQAGSGLTQIRFGDQTEIIAQPAIPPGGSFPFTASFTLTAEGMQAVTVIADSGNAIDESNESNNIAQTVVIVLPPLLPDLLIASTVDTVSRKGINYNHSITVRVENRGLVASGSCQLKLVVTELGKTYLQTIPGLAPNATYQVKFAVNKVRLSSLTLRLTVDSLNQVVESNETNNSWSK